MKNASVGGPVSALFSAVITRKGPGELRSSCTKLWTAGIKLHAHAVDFLPEFPSPISITATLRDMLCIRQAEFFGVAGSLSCCIARITRTWFLPELTVLRLPDKPRGRLAVLLSADWGQCQEESRQTVAMC